MESLSSGVLSRLSERDEVDRRSHHYFFQYLLAAFIPSLVTLSRYFTDVIWPNWLYWCITTFLLRREVNVVEDTDNVGSNGGASKMVSNAALMEAVSRYCSHLNDRILERKNGAVAGEKAQLQKRGHRFFQTVVPHGDYMYLPRLMTTGMETNANYKISKECRGAVMADILQRDYSVVLVPSGDTAMEVEPGLFVQFESTLVAPQRHEQQEQQEQAPVPQRNFWTADMENALRDGNGRRMPFELEDPEENSEDSDTISSDEEPTEEPVRRIFIRCCTLIGAGEVAAYKAWLSEIQEEEEEGSSLGMIGETVLDPRNRINAFIGRARRWYFKERESTRATAERQSYIMYSACSEIEAKFKMADELNQDDDSYDSEYEMISAEYNGPVMEIRRFTLCFEKPSLFDSLFFPEKDLLQRLITNFKERSGIYARPSYPHHLHILLSSAERGTGTTSVVKAIAQRLKRSVFVISLRSIFTNDGLRTWLNPLRVKCEGEKVQVNAYDDDDDYYDDDEVGEKYVHTVLRPEEVVYLIEDMDKIGCDEYVQLGMQLAAQVHKANEESKAAAAEKKQAAADKKKAEETAHSDQEDSDEDEESEGDSDLSCFDEEDGSDDEAKNRKKQERKDMFFADFFASFSENSLSVDGVANMLLPNIAESQRRVVVFTTSQPVESLNTEWFRPFLLNMHIQLKCVATKEACDIITLFTGEPTPAEKEEIRCVLNHEACKLLPAVLQEYCVESASVAEVIVKMRGYADAQAF